MHFSAICFLSECSLKHPLTCLLTAIVTFPWERDAAQHCALKLRLPVTPWPWFLCLVRQGRWPRSGNAVRFLPTHHHTGVGDNTCLDNAFGRILGVSCAVPGAGLDEPDGPLPAQLIPWSCDWWASSIITLWGCKSWVPSSRGTSP